MGPTRSCCTVGTLKVIDIQQGVMKVERRIAYLVHRLVIAKKFRVLVGDVFAYITSAFEHLSASKAPELLLFFLVEMVFGDDRELTGIHKYIVSQAHKEGMRSGPTRHNSCLHT